MNSEGVHPVKAFKRKPIFVLSFAADEHARFVREGATLAPRDLPWSLRHWLSGGGVLQWEPRRRVAHPSAPGSNSPRD